MAKYLGIWTRDMSKENIKSLYNAGFNSLFMDFEPFWKEVENNTSLPTFEMKKTKALQNYISAYKEYRKMGYEKFIMGIGSCGMTEQNSWWKLFSESLPNDDFIMYAGEFIETFYERQPTDSLVFNDNKPWTKDDVVNKLLKYRKSIDNRFKFDACKRNYDYLNEKFPNEVSVSSYLFQSSKWHKNFPFIWIMGQPSWHLWNTWWYSYLNRKAKKYEIDIVFLYQGNKPEWTSDGWEMYILTKLKISNWIEKIRRKWFIYIFKN
jgi:hypothetical protein